MARYIFHNGKLNTPAYTENDDLDPVGRISERSRMAPPPRKSVTNF